MKNTLRKTLSLLMTLTVLLSALPAAASEAYGEQLIAKERKIYKGVSANVDFYSGFIYSMLDLPMELYTPIFAISRIAGWSAHRIEELANAGKIVRPAYKYVGHHVDYEELEERK